MKLIFKLSLFTILLAISASHAHAQIPSTIDGVTINTEVDNPKPGQTVGIYVESYIVDLNSSSIVWIVDGKTQNQGIGIKRTEINAPKIGGKVTISVIIKAPNGAEMRKSIVIKSGSVDIVWETAGYAHPFFEGKLPFVYQNKIRFIAMPNLSKDGVKELDPKTLVYTWKQDGKYVENGQGYGKQYVEIQASDIPKTIDLTVEVHDRDQTVSSQASISLEPTEPTVSFYEEDSLYGLLFNKALADRTPLRNSEMKVIAIPYGFNMHKNTNSYTWSINDIYQPDLVKNRSITIRTKGDADGSSNIALDIRNVDSILQGARSAFTVYFSKKQEAPASGATF